MKNLSLFSKIILFLTSYSPLGIMYIIIDMNFSKKLLCFSNPFPIAVLFIIIVISWVLLFFLLFHFRKSEDKITIEVKNCESLNKEIFSYIFSYILPFMGFPEGKAIPLTFFWLFVIGILYIKSEMLGINPVLSLFGYHLIKITGGLDSWKKSKEYILIGKKSFYEIKNAHKVKITKMNNEIHLLREVIS